MKGLAIANKGLEDVTSLEIKELIKSKTQIKESCIIFEISKFEDLYTLCYKAQSVSRILFLLNFFEFKSLDEIKKKIKIDNLGDFLDKTTTFKVVCKRIGEHNFKSEDVSKSIGEILFGNLKKKVSLENPDLIFYVYICNNACYFGIDFAGFDLSKRQYKIFSTPTSLKGTVAYSLLRIAGITKNDKILDPFCGDGVILIESALFLNNFPVNYFNKDKFAFLRFKFFGKPDIFFGKIDKKIIKNKKNAIYSFDSELRHIKAAQKNSKIAGISKQINFSKTAVEWLDIKFKNNEIGRIITSPPQISKNIDIKEIEKLYNEFFYQADFILAKDGKIVLITREKDVLVKSADKRKFVLENEKEVWSGQQKLLVLCFVRK